jgi:hypothetical protein
MGLMTVIKNGVLRGQISGIRVQPGIDVFWLDGNDATVVPCQYDFRRRVVRDGGKRKEPYNSTLIVFMTWFILYFEKACTSRFPKRDWAHQSPISWRWWEC